MSSRYTDIVVQRQARAWVCFIDSESAILGAGGRLSWRRHAVAGAPLTPTAGRSELLYPAAI